MEMSERLQCIQRIVVDCSISKVKDESTGRMSSGFFCNQSLPTIAFKFVCTLRTLVLSSYCGCLKDCLVYD